MAHLQLSAVAAGGRPEGAGDDMEDVALLGAYDEEMGVPSGGAGWAEEDEEEEAQVRVTGMTCSACSSAVEAAVSARRGVRTVAVSLLQNRARVVFVPALIKVRWRDVILACLLCSAPTAARPAVIMSDVIIPELLDALGVVNFCG